MTSKFKVGDKVVPVSKVEFGGLSSSVEWKQANEMHQGYLYVNHIKEDGTVTCHHKQVDYHTGDWFSESDLIPYEKPTKNQRITKLEEEVAELKLIVAQIRKPSTVVEEALANDTIEFEGKSYQKVDREAREGDVVIVAELKINHSAYIKTQKPYLVLPGVMITDEDQCGYKSVFNVYSAEYNRTPETVDVYELIVEDKQDNEPLIPFGYEEKTLNQLRAEIIEKAKGFVENYKTSLSGYDTREEGNDTCREHFYDTDFFIKGNKVTAVVYRRIWDESRINKPKNIGRANCMPGDVFNEHIGKAIALGRALGLDVSEFEQAVQPTELVGGAEVQFNDFKTNYVMKKTDLKIAQKDLNKGEIKIINDTNAIYSEVTK